jgi:hypothetical protein
LLWLACYQMLCTFPGEHPIMCGAPMGTWHPCPWACTSHEPPFPPLLSLTYCHLMPLLATLSLEIYCYLDGLWTFHCWIIGLDLDRNRKFVVWVELCKL